MRFVVIIIFLVCAACHQETTPEFVPAHSRKVAIKLMDSLGMITMYVPTRYDTGFAWVHESDCPGCEDMKCRFQSSSWRMYKESGWFYYPPSDSVDRVTIIYSPHFDLYEHDTSWIYQQNKWFREQKKIENPVGNNIFVDTLCRIYDRPFSITGTHFYNDVVCREFYELNGVTAVRGLAVKFKFELITEKGDPLSKQFLKNALDVLKTVRFTKPS